MTSESLSIHAKESHLLVEFFGAFSVAMGKQCVDRMAAACEEHQRWQVLLDCRKMTGIMRIFDRFEVVEYGATRRHVLKRVAILVREGTPLPDNFVENVAVNRGMDLRVFTDFEAAEHWIALPSPNDPDESSDT